MKRLVLFSIALIIAGAVNAQSQKINSHDAVLTKYVRTSTDAVVNNGQKVRVGTMKPANDKKLGEKILGKTTYDLQTNNSVHDRVARDASGNMSVVWTASLQNSGGWSDRGAGYSYYDNSTSSWTLSSSYPRIESDRCGWPTMLYDGNGGEIIISHSTASEHLKLNSRSTKGTGTWSEKAITSGYKLWNRAAMGGNDGNTIHMICAADADDSAMYQNIVNPILYYRSQDAGSTFDITELILPGLDSGSIGVGSILNADAYSIAAKGSHVAIGVFSPFTKVMLLESMDNGSTWTNTAVQDFPYRGFDDFWAKYDTTGKNNPFIETNDGSGTVLIDANGDVHMVWGRLQAYPNYGTPGSYFRRSFLDSLRYYQHGTPGYHGFAGNWVDANNDSLFNPNQAAYGWQSGSIVTYPNLASNAAGDTLVLTYSGITDTVAGFANQTRLQHIFMTTSADGGMTWTAPLDLTPYDEFTECTFADVFPVVDNRVRLIYQKDVYPSVYVSYFSSTAPSTNYEWQEQLSENDIIYLEVTTDGDGIGIVGLEKVLNPETETGVFPNPSNGVIDLNLVVYQDVEVSISVLNMGGQTVYTHNNQEITKGRNQIRMDLSNQEPGMYFVNILAGGKLITEKVVIK